MSCFYAEKITAGVARQVNQQKAKLIDLEANVTLQERSNGKVDILIALLKGSSGKQAIR